jgi:hypothetical protein
MDYFFDLSPRERDEAEADAKGPKTVLHDLHDRNHELEHSEQTSA